MGLLYYGAQLTPTAYVINSVRSLSGKLQSAASGRGETFTLAAPTNELAGRIAQ
jgi:hypothetical protein